MELDDLAKDTQEAMDRAMKQINDLNIDQLSKESLELLTKAKEGKITAKEAAEIGKRLMEKYAGND